MTVGVALSDLLDALEAFAPRLVSGSALAEAGPVVLDVCQDSRDVGPGALFVARVGGRVDGMQFAPRAIERGAVAVMTESSRRDLELPVPVVAVEGIERAIGFAAECVQGRPSHALSLVGITGTNGKTTIASLVRQALAHAGRRCAQLGTLGFEFEGGLAPSGLTTPQADAVSRFLAQVAGKGASHAVMEVSSHALEQGRVDALRFEVAAFTNLTQDHLDYHGSMEAYGAAKARLFTELQPKHTVINVLDPFGRELASRLGAGVVRVGRATTPSAGGPSGLSDVALSSRRDVPMGVELCMNTPVGDVRFVTDLVGEHNVDNWLVSVGILVSLGLDAATLSDVCSHVSAAPGRMERCELASDDIAVLVDYAHTPDALERALAASRELALRRGGRLWCIFGCGGDRDRTKRPKMGSAAARLADVAIVTNDNPRSEDPSAIAGDITAGMSDGAGAYSVCLDRREAIRRAVDEAAPNDVVLIAGKGHENYQIMGSQVLDFDDRDEARTALRRRRERG